MKNNSAFILGLFVFLGLSFLGYFIGDSLIKYKNFERTVTVKGLSEREVKANIVIWPIGFSRASNDLNVLNNSLENDLQIIKTFLKENNIKDNEISILPPYIQDRLAQGYGSNSNKLRYTGNQTVRIYTTDVDKVRNAIFKTVELSKKGIFLAQDDYRNTTDFIYNKLNEIKPEMIEEATNKAREVAEKFAKDSNSKLGKIKKARQGQFSINNRDKNTQHIKNVRVVSTIEYYLSD